MKIHAKQSDRHQQSNAAHSFSGGGDHPLSALQRTLGNKATEHILRSLIQTKLTVNAPGDIYEQEADRMADQVMSNASAKATTEISRSIQRRLSRKEVDPTQVVDSMPPPEEAGIPAPPTPAVQRSSSGGPATVNQSFEHSLGSAVQSGGEKLPVSALSFMETRFGADFSSVRIHRDSQAHELATAVNARAFTTANNIFFARSEYQPETDQGRRLLAHELTHVIQQSGSDGISPKYIQRAACSAYTSWDHSRDLTTYNCAGLALRNYQYLSPAFSVRQAIASQFSPGQCMINCDVPCRPGQVKFWLWEYDMHSEDDQGNRLGPDHRDFHIVGGVTDSSGHGQGNVYSKNGARPVTGPGTGPSFRPPTRAVYLSNDPQAQPTTYQGRTVYVVRSNYTETCDCGTCT